MSKIVLTDEQARSVREAVGRVAICDPAGEVLAEIDPLDIRALLNYRGQLSRPRKAVPAARVKEHMRALEAEWERTGGFDEAYARAFMARQRERDERDAV